MTNPGGSTEATQAWDSWAPDTQPVCGTKGSRLLALECAKVEGRGGLVSVSDSGVCKVHPLEDAEGAGMEDTRQAEAGRAADPFPGSLLPSKPAAQKGERRRGPVVPDRLGGGTEKAEAEGTPRAGLPWRLLGGSPRGLQSRSWHGDRSSCGRGDKE